MFLDPARGIKWTLVRRADLHDRAVLDQRLGNFQPPERMVRQRGDLPRQPEMTEQIGAVRRDFDIKYGVVREKLPDWGADSRLGREDEQAGGILGNPKLFCAAKHALRFDPAQLARPDREFVRQDCARERERHLVADFVVLRSANDLPRLAAAIVHLADAQAIGAGVLCRCGDPSDDDMVEIRTASFDAFDLNARQSEQLGQLPDVVRQFDKFTEPVPRKLHDAPSPGRFCG